MRLKNIVIGTVVALPTLSLLGYWLFWQAMEAVGKAVDNMADNWGDWDDDEEYDWYYGGES